jgi:2-keto-4-pentenoate hydratase/2-oxohepta-3-ene-1,7-dioic acid hydratase in catechol pathway
VVFTKFPTCITGPNTVVVLPSASIDWEAELVIVIGTGGHLIPPESAWGAIAGFTIGQDLSDRVLQLNYDRPQFSLAKSRPGFGPTGPVLVTTDEFADPDTMHVRCVINGRTRQDFTTDRLIFTVPNIVVELSKIVTLLPGDIIFTGTSSGVGMIQDPPEYLQPGDEIVTSIDGIGSMTTRFVGA